MNTHNSTQYLLNEDQPGGCEFSAYDALSGNLLSSGTALVKSGLAFREEDYVHSWSCPCCDEEFMSFTLGYHTNVDPNSSRQTRVELILEIPSQHISEGIASQGLPENCPPLLYGYHPALITLIPSDRPLSDSA